MSRKLKKDEVLKQDHVYGYDQSDNQFKILSVYKFYIWIEWQASLDVETVFVTRAFRRKILVLK